MDEEMIIELKHRVEHIENCLKRIDTWQKNQNKDLIDIAATQFSLKIEFDILKNELNKIKGEQKNGIQ